MLTESWSSDTLTAKVPARTVQHSKADITVQFTKRNTHFDNVRGSSKLSPIAHFLVLNYSPIICWTKNDNKTMLRNETSEK